MRYWIKNLQAEWQLYSLVIRHLLPWVPVAFIASYPFGLVWLFFFPAETAATMVRTAVYIPLNPLSLVFVVIATVSAAGSIVEFAKMVETQMTENRIRKLAIWARNRIWLPSVGQVVVIAAIHFYGWKSPVNVLMGVALDLVALFGSLHFMGNPFSMAGFGTSLAQILSNERSSTPRGSEVLLGRYSYEGIRDEATSSLSGASRDPFTIRPEDHVADREEDPDASRQSVRGTGTEVVGPAQQSRKPRPSLRD